jgi:hypothetical protein
MMKQLLLTALATAGGCDHQLGIGALGPDAEVAPSGRDAGTSSIDVGKEVALSGWEAGSASVDMGKEAQTSLPNDPDAQSLLANDTGGGVGVPPDDAADAGVLKPLVPGPTTWTGFTEDIDHEFPSGSNAIRFTFAVDPYGQVAGMVFLGAGPAPPPATNPDVGYPPEPWVASNQDPSDYWAEGFGYSMAQGIFEPERLHFVIDKHELWAGWCALQPVTWANDSGSCLPSWESVSTTLASGAPYCYQNNPTNKQATVRDCGKLALCTLNPVCICSIDACTYSPSDFSSIAGFELVLSNGTATGRVDGIFNSYGIVHFTQDP